VTLKRSSQTQSVLWLDQFHAVYFPFLKALIHLIEPKHACITNTRVRSWTLLFCTLCLLYLYINDIIMLLCPSHVIRVTAEEEMYCAGFIKVGRGFIAHMRLEQSFLCNCVYSSPHEADL
jgi:hypothetical protein